MTLIEVRILMLALTLTDPEHQVLDPKVLLSIQRRGSI
jgi:hypothetical protein